MNTKLNALKRALATFFVVSAITMTVFAQEAGRFRPASGHDPVIGRYFVALAENADETAADALVRAYGGRVEPFSAEGVRGFLISMPPARARALSQDGRVLYVEEQQRASSTSPRFEAAPQWTATATLWQSGTYSYDGSGHVMEIGDDRYRYDAFGRVNYATAKTPGNPANLQKFTYDRYGNHLTTEVTTANGSTTEAYAVEASSNQLGIACTGAPAICYTATYDNAGRQLGRYNGTEYQWDALGMLKEVNSMRHEQYLYDANDERVTVIHYTGSTEIRRRYTLRGADNKVARELTFTTATSSWALTKDYVHRPGGVLASYSGAGTTPDRHYHLDHLGSTRLVTDGAGYKVAIHTYWPFGREADGSELDQERLKFTGHERDSSGGTPGFDLDYMHARYYDPNHKRFLSIDPKIDSSDPVRPQTWNRYTYAENNPVFRVDPDGRQAVDPRQSFRQLAISALMLKTAADNLKIHGPSVAGNWVGRLAAPGVKGWDYVGFGFSDAMENGRDVLSFTFQKKGLGVDLSIDFGSMDKSNLSVLGLIGKKTLIGPEPDKLVTGLGPVFDAEIEVPVLADRIVELAQMSDWELMKELLEEFPQLDPLFEEVYGTDHDDK